MDRRLFLKASAAVGALSGAGLLAACGKGAGGSAGAKTLKVIHTTGLTSLDPVWTTAGATKDYAYLTFDQLISLDENYKPKPQMAEWTVEDDGKTYLFKLRDGLKWHDDKPVTAKDCIASIKRWAAGGRAW